MKKNIIFRKMVLVGLLLLFSCNQDDFLTTKPSETISNPPLEYRVNGLYSLMIRPGTGGTTGHDDFGQKGYDIFTDLIQSDVVLDGTTYGWYSGIANYSWVIDHTNTRTYMPWRYYYRVIYAANDIIDDLGGTDYEPTSISERHLMGQAKAIRAYAYLYLVQMYAKSYRPNEEAIPIYTSKYDKSQPKSKQSDVYDQIIHDLRQSENYLVDYVRNNKAKIDRTVVTGLLAYTYAAMGENNLAANEAAKIVNSSYSITSKQDVAYDPDNLGTYGGFNNVATPSWIWGVDITIENDLDLVSWWGQMDIFTYSYASVGDSKSIDRNLREFIHDDDVRKKQFVLRRGKYLGIGKFYTPQRIIQGQRNVETDYIYMRADEFHLLYAETLAKSGQEALAKAVLKNFLSGNRMENTSYIDNLSGESLVNEIYMQTRLELWGEGKAYFAMKRNLVPVIRGSTHLFYANETIPLIDDRLTFKIPQAEILDNPYIN